MSGEEVPIIVVNFGEEMEQIKSIHTQTAVIENAGFKGKETVDMH